ncbi:MAG: hypothetical protein P4L50_20135 [Anaerolineaceae bacterium]|nr:hypothetical protein [Anaerolineaceae bacterium]
MQTKYHELPDYLLVEELQRHFNNLMNTVEGSNNIDYDGVVNSLWELADRQWHTYEILENGTKGRVESFINKVLLSELWKGKQVIFLRCLLSIIGNIGLSSSYALIKEIYNRDMPPIFKQEIFKLIDAVDKHEGGNVDDPYITFKKG